MVHQFRGRWPGSVIELESFLQEFHGGGGYIRRNDGFRRARSELTTTVNIVLSGKSHVHTLKMACIWENSGKGCWLVSISMIRQPTLHISALLV